MLLNYFLKRSEKPKSNIDKIHRPKRAKVLPNVLSKEEVKLILKPTATSNTKRC